jgi:prophage DNA circulation protein
VQDLGQSTVRYPMRLYISGADYDTEADRFWTALNEPGAAQLAHPRYGNIPVVPVSVTQTEQFVEGAGRATFEVDFVEADEDQFTYPQQARRSPEAISAQAAAAAAAATSAAGEATVDTPGAAEVIKDTVLDAIDTVTGAFDEITGITNEIRTAISDQVREITDTIDDLAEAPAGLLGELVTLYRLPSRVITDVIDKINGYSAIFQGLAGAFRDTTAEYGELFSILRGANTAAMLAASSEATADGFIATRADAARIVDTLSGIEAGAAEIFGELETVDYDMQWAARDAATVALVSLQERALNLPLEQSLTLEADEPVIPLVDRLYGDIGDFDGTIDEFIRYNNLAGDEILIVPAGRTVRWYE